MTELHSTDVFIRDIGNIPISFSVLHKEKKYIVTHICTSLSDLYYIIDSCRTCSNDIPNFYVGKEYSLSEKSKTILELYPYSDTD